jgi:hypothetical protein
MNLPSVAWHIIKEMRTHAFDNMITLLFFWLIEAVVSTQN